MINRDNEINELELHAYVDDQLTAERREVVERYLQRNPLVKKQIQQWEQQNDEINELFSNQEFEDTSKKFNIRDSEDNSGNFIKKKVIGKSWFRSLAASFLLIGFGWMSHNFYQSINLNQNTRNFVNSAISAYQVFSVEIKHPVEVTAKNPELLMDWLSKRIRHELPAPDLENYGYRLLGGRLLSMREGNTAAQLMFENSTGNRITLLASKNPKYRDQPFNYRNEQDIHAYFWMNNQVAYSITGKLENKLLRKLSHSIYEQLSQNQTIQITSL